MVENGINKLTIELDKFEVNEAFNADLALNDNNLIVSKSTIGSDNEVITNFRKNDTNLYISYPYVGTINGKNVYFDKNGISKDGQSQVIIADATIDTQIGGDNVATRGNGGEGGEIIKVTLSSLNFREQIAMNVLNKFLEKETDPYAISNGRIKILISRAFDYAQEFINQAAAKRTGDVAVAEPIYKVKVLETVSTKVEGTVSTKEEAAETSTTTTE